MPKVSVIVPVYNAEPYLRKCLDSLVNQTLKEIEILVVNDGSTDNSLSILEGYRSQYPEKIKVFSKENGGQASARNLALKYAEGEYIGFVDADDYAALDMFRAMYAAAENTDADLVVCDHYHVVGKKQKYIRFPDYDTPRKMFGAVLVSPWNKLLRRDVLLQSGVVFPEGYIYEDTAWFAELIPFIQTMTYVHEPLLYHIVQENSTMTTAQGQRTGQIFPVMNGILDFYRERGLYAEYEDDLKQFYTRILLLSSMRRISKIEHKPLRREMEQRTLKELETHFPDFRETCREEGWRGQYIRYASPGTLNLFAALCRIFL